MIRLADHQHRGVDAAATVASQDLTTRIVTPQGWVQVDIDKEALLRLGAQDEAASLQATLSRHLPRIHALALQLAWREPGATIRIREDDIWWP